MAKIVAPNDQYSGISATVQFNQGVGNTADPWLIEWFRSRGYTIVEDAVQGSKFDNMTVKELKAYAEENEIELGKVTNKAGIIKLILEAEEAKKPDDQDDQNNEDDQDEKGTD
jgi:hypothetical protein